MTAMLRTLPALTPSPPPLSTIAPPHRPYLLAMTLPALTPERRAQ